ncbi:MAG: polymer-forming cytoskeletal protein [Alphaproteobacteria bacterium]
MIGQKSPPGAPRHETRGPGLTPVTPAPRIPAAPRPGDLSKRNAVPRTAALRTTGETEKSDVAPLPFDPRRDEGRLVVGAGIELKGDVSACSRLVIEGCFEGNVKESNALIIAEGGAYRGDAEVDEADVSGDFDGTLTVRERLTVRATGRVGGEVRYGELEIERGGRLAGAISCAAGQQNDEMAQTDGDA